MKAFTCSAVFWFILAVSLVASADPLSKPFPDRQSRLDYFHSLVKRDLGKFQSHLDTPDTDPTVRTYTHAAYCALAIGMDPRLAQDYIRRALDHQNMDPASSDFGNVPWEIVSRGINDPNSIEFTFSPIGPILVGYSDKLSPDFKKDLATHVVAAIQAIYRHKVPVTYTNIYLMKTENLILLGEAINDPKAIAAGRAQLDTWLDFTRAYGIHEYDSPTYASVQMYCAMDVYRQTRLPEVRAKFKTVLDYLWADAAANFSATPAMMAGPHSRDYDFIRATGPFDRFYFLEGLTDTSFGNAIFVDSYGAYLNALEHGYEPSAEILSLAREPQRIVKQIWGQTPGADRYTYITPDFAIGSTSAYGGAQDREIAVDFASDDYSPAAICVAGDTFDSPYGKVRQKDRTGHDKPFRLHTYTAAVQDHGTVLALLDLSPDLPHTSAQTVATDVLLPINGSRITLNGQEVRFPEDAHAAEAQTLARQPVDSKSWDSWSVPAHLNSILTVSCGQAAVAIRIFATDGVDKQSPFFALKCDGAQWGAGRFVAYNYRGDARKIDQKPIRAGILIIARQCKRDGDVEALANDVRNAEIRQNSNANTWDVTATIPNASPQSLESSLDLTTGAPAARRINGAPYVPDRFTVNGRDISAQIFESSGAR